MWPPRHAGPFGYGRSQLGAPHVRVASPKLASIFGARPSDFSSTSLCLTTSPEFCRACRGAAAGSCKKWTRTARPQLLICCPSPRYPPPPPPHGHWSDGTDHGPGCPTTTLHPSTSAVLVDFPSCIPTIPQGCADEVAHTVHLKVYRQYGTKASLLPQAPIRSRWEWLNTNASTLPGIEVDLQDFIAHPPHVQPLLDDLTVQPKAATAANREFGTAQKQAYTPQKNRPRQILESVVGWLAGGGGPPTWGGRCGIAGRHPA